MLGINISKINLYFMFVYHASPNSNIKKLKKLSYVTLFPHMAYYMGLYFTQTGKTWNDSDLKSPYKFTDKISFKNKPDGVPTLYRLQINPIDIILHDNFPFEFQIKKSVKVEIVSSKNIKKINKDSVKMLKQMDKLNFD